jgi:hypothetical protein
MPMPVTTVATRAVAVALVAVALGACSLTSSSGGPQEWTQEVQGQDGTSQTITVRDEAGRLTNVEIDPPGVPMAAEIENPDGQPNVVLVPWTGGACDTSTEIVFDPAGEGLAGTLDIETSGDMCIMLAVPHQLRLTSANPLPADKVTLEPAAP